MMIAQIQFVDEDTPTKWFRGCSMVPRVGDMVALPCADASDPWWTVTAVRWEWMEIGTPSIIISVIRQA